MHRPVLIFLRGSVEPRAIKRIKSIKDSNETNTKRTRDLPACSKVPQPIAPSPKTRHVQHLLLETLSISDGPPTAQRPAN
jgi:hypothetical protein